MSSSRPARLRLLLALAGFLCLAADVTATAPAVDPVLAAHEAYRSRDLAALEKLAERSAGLPLGDYIQFWWIEARLSTALRLVPPSEVHRFLARTDGPLPERLRIDWLKALAQQQSWPDLLTDASGYAGNEPEVLCGLANARPGDPDGEAANALRSLWLSGRTMPPGCDGVFARMLAIGRLSSEDVMSRFRRALELDNAGVARSTAALLPPEQALPDTMLVQAAADPAAWLEHLATHPRLHSWRLLELAALNQVARADPPRARALWERGAGGLTPQERAQGWLRIGVQAAQRLDPDALSDFRRAHDASFQEADLPWWVRAALRAGAWDEVLLATDQMSEAQAAVPAWRYWRARALKALGRRDEAMEQFAAVGHLTDFYGQLASEELGQRVVLGGGAHAEPDEVAQVRQRPGVQRALGLFRLGLQTEAVQEWNWSMRGSADHQWLAAADVAREAGWYDRMISSAEKGGPDADAALRYPLPFRESMRNRAHENGLDESWMYGLVRQESRFLPEAVSRSGAQGLMQLMPATARWVARKIGLRDFKPSHSQEVQTNIQLGSYYLHHVLDSLGNPVLATAGYNAGPNRVRRWLEAHALDGAVFCETIPVAETRDYVQKVMANATMYAQRLGQAGRGLKTRLGTIKGLAGLPAPDASDGNGSLDVPYPSAVPLPPADSAAVPSGTLAAPASASASAPAPASAPASATPALPAAPVAVAVPAASPSRPAAPATPSAPASAAAPAAASPPLSSPQGEDVLVPVDP